PAAAVARAGATESIGAAAERAASAAAREIAGADAITAAKAANLAAAQATAIAHIACTRTIAKTTSAAAIAKTTRPDCAAARIAALTRKLLRRIRLAIRQRVTSSGSAESVRGGAVGVRGAGAIRGVVLPGAASIGVDIRVAVEGVVSVDVDGVIAPAGAPPPSAAKCGTHRDTSAEGDGCCACGIAPRRIGDRRIWIDGRPVDSQRVVRRNVDYLRIRLLDHDHLLVVGGLGLHCLLWCRFQRAGCLRFLPHALHGIHHVALLRKKGIAKVCRPLDVFS